MTNFCSSHRVPRARVDPIVDDATARRLIESVLAQPRRCEVVAILLDHERRGISIVSVTDVVDPDGVHGVADTLIDACSMQHRVGAVILVSVRADGLDELDDIERWLTLDDQFAAVGVELVEWYVYGFGEASGISRPRALLGEPVRWDA